MPYVSIIVPTMRVGGIDVLFDSLARQTYTDFELVLSDGLRRYRIDRVEQAARDRFLRVVHVEPRPNPFPLCAYCAYANAGLDAAGGEVALFLTDYSRLPLDLVGAHAAYHKADTGNRGGLMCPHRYVHLDPYDQMRRYAQSDVDKYVRDVESGMLHSFMLSTGTVVDRPADPWPVDGGRLAQADADPKLRMPAGPIEPGFFHAKNESVRLHLAREIGGWDEDLDGSHGWQDSDFADRLTTLARVRWTLDPRHVVEIANPRNVFPLARRTREFGSNEQIWQRKRAAGYPQHVERRSKIQISVNIPPAAVDDLRQQADKRGTSKLKSGSDYTRKTCTCGVGPWDKDGNCSNCHGADHGMPTFDTSLTEVLKSLPVTQSLQGGCKLKIAMIYGEFSSAIHGPFDLEGLYTRTGLTGSESSFFNLARTLAERGHQVLALCHCDAPAQHPSSLTIFPIALIHKLPEIELDAVIAWNEPDYLRFAPSGVLRIVDQQLNDWGYCRVPEWQDMVDMFVFPSDSSRKNHLSQLKENRTTAIIPNSVDLDLFVGDSPARNPHRVVYCSSPDRGLHHLLSWWPAIRKRVHDAELRIFYRLEPWLERARGNNDEVGRRARYIEEALRRLTAGDYGVTVPGPVPNSQMARELQAASVLAYPCDPVRYTEGFGCSVLDAAAAGCLPIISDADALTEVHAPGGAIVVPSSPGKMTDRWVELVCGAFDSSKEWYSQFRSRMASHAAAHSRHVIAEQWERLLLSRVRPA